MLKMENIEFYIKENSWLAKLAALKLKTDAVAIVFGNTIHLYHTRSDEFMQNKKWLRHELCHVMQYRQHGLIGFIVKYLYESIRHGYYNNRFEIEARNASEEVGL